MDVGSCAQATTASARTTGNFFIGPPGPDANAAVGKLRPARAPVAGSTRLLAAAAGAAWAAGALRGGRGAAAARTAARAAAGRARRRAAACGGAALGGARATGGRLVTMAASERECERCSNDHQNFHASSVGKRHLPPSKHRAVVASAP